MGPQVYIRGFIILLVVIIWEKSFKIMSNMQDSLCSVGMCLFTPCSAWQGWSYNGKILFFLWKIKCSGKQCGPWAPGLKIAVMLYETFGVTSHLWTDITVYYYEKIKTYWISTYVYNVGKFLLLYCITIIILQIEINHIQWQKLTWNVILCRPGIHYTPSIKFQ